MKCFGRKTRSKLYGLFLTERNCEYVNVLCRRYREYPIITHSTFLLFFFNFFFSLSNYTEPRKYNCSKNSLHTPRSITIYLFPTQHYDTPKMSCASSDFLYFLRKLFMTKLTGFFVLHIRRARYDCFGTRSSGLRTWYQRRQCTSS